jgi:hypothetical protein
MSTAIQAAKHVCLSPSRFRDLVAESVFKRMPSGQYDLKTVRESYCLHMQKIAAGRAADGGASLSAQRSRLAKAQAENAEFKNALAAGRFVDLEIVQRQLEAKLTTMREVALGTPGKIADSLTPHCAEDREAIFEIIRGEVYEMLTSLSEPGSYSAGIADKGASK